MADPTKSPLPTLRTYAHDLELERQRRGLPATATAVTTAPATSAPAAKVKQVPPLPPAPPKTKSPISVPEEKKIAPRVTIATKPAETRAAHSALPTTIPPFHALHNSVRRESPTSAEATPPQSVITINNDESGAVVITDTKTSHFSVSSGILASLKAWWARLLSARRARALPKYVVTETDRRKGVIQRATSQTGRAITDDSIPLRELVSQRNATPSDPPITVVPPRPIPPPAPSNVVVMEKQRPVVAPQPVFEEIVPSTPPPVVIETPPPVRETPPPLLTIEVPEEKTEPEPAPVPAKTTPPPARPRTKPRVSLRTLLIVLLAVIVMTALGVLFMRGAISVPSLPDLPSLPSFTSTSPDTPTVPAPITRLLIDAPLTFSPITAEDRTSIISALHSKPASSTETVQVTALTYGGLTLSATTFLKLLDPQINPYLIYDTETVVGGYVEGSRPFLVLRVSDRTSAWGSMLQWEDTMAEALTPLFSISDTVELPFTDLRVDASDVRIRRDGSMSEIVYGFADDRTIIITTDTETFARLSALVLKTN